MIEKDLWRKLLAEFVGTFILVSAIVFPAIALREAGLGAFLFIMFTAGLGYAIAVWMFRDISGAHVNPAVTFGMMLIGKVKLLTGVFYWIVQLAAAFVATWYAIATFRLDTGSASELGNYGMAMPTPSYKDIQYMLAEAIGAFVLVGVVMFFLNLKDRYQAGLAIGAAFLVAIVMAVPVSGGAINPAREFAPMILARGFKAVYLWYYLVAPFVGAAVAAIFYYIFAPDDAKLSLPKVQLASRKK